MIEHLAAKTGKTVEQASEMLDHVDRLAAAEGLDFRLGDTPGGNTFAAHRLVHLGGEHHKAGEVKEALLHAYFIELRPIGDLGVLAQIAQRCGLPADEVDATLAGDRFADAVRADEAEAARLGATGVPFYVFDRRFAVAGAQSPDVFLDVLRRTYDAEVEDSQAAPRIG
jgi:predicted DsbA family dithiol-disulfide isomerase